MRDYKLAEEGGLWAWRRLFLLLATRWAEQFLPILNVETTKPDVLRRIARAFLSDFEALYNRHLEVDDDDVWSVGGQQLIEATFSEFDRSLGLDVSQRIYQLGIRDWENGENDWLWGMLLSRVIVDRSGDAFPLRGSKRQLLLNLLEEGDRRTPVPKGEDVAGDPEDRDLVNRFRDVFGEPIDIAMEMREMLERTALHATWKRIAGVLEAPDLISLREWVRAEGLAMGIDPTEIDFPE